MYALKFVGFQNERLDMNKDKRSSDPASKNASVTILSKTTSRKTSKLLAEMVQTNGLFQPGLQISSTLFQHTETKQKK